MKYPGNSDSRLWETPIWNPPTDIFETSDELVIRIEIAGMSENDFYVEVHGKKLIIKGERTNSQERLIYHQMEINYGEFTVTIDLPQSFETEHISAVYRNGFLEICLPRSFPRHIEIQTDDGPQ